MEGRDYDEYAAVKTGVVFGVLPPLVEFVTENNPVPANHFFRFAERAVCYHGLPPDRFTFIREPLPTFHFSLVNQLIKPNIELVDRVLCFFPRKSAVPLSSGTFLDFGCWMVFAHYGLTF